MNVEDQINKVSKQADKSAKAYGDKLKSLRKKLKKCQHKYTTESVWEWDNGYGRQSKVAGQRCLSCGSEKRWPASYIWSIPE